MAVSRAILHIDMDAFFASVEQRDHPEYRGKPVIVGADPHQRGVVSTCSYEARKFGVHSAMPSREAFRLCPEGIFVHPNMKRYHAASRQVFEIMARYSPTIEPVSCDEAFLDVTTVQRLFGTPKEIGATIKAAIRQEVGLTASVGVAQNKFLAKLASEERKPDGLFCVPQEKQALGRWLGAKKIGALWGVGHVLEAALVKAGICWVRDIQQADPQRLVALVGESMAQHLMNMAFGRDEREVISEQEEKSFSREVTFLEDVTEREPLHAELLRIADDVGRRLRRAGKFARTGKLKLRWKDFTTLSRQQTFPIAVQDNFSLREMAIQLFEHEPLIQPVRLIGFGACGLVDSNEPGDLFGLPEQLKKRQAVCEALDAFESRKKPVADAESMEEL